MANFNSYVNLPYEKRANATSWICFDEIHKMKKWKDVLKDAFDTYEDSLRFIVTGSAKLDVFRKAGDSLAGRYLIFHLDPLSLSEATGEKEQFFPSEGQSAEAWLTHQIHRPEARAAELESLLTLG